MFSGLTEEQNYIIEMAQKSHDALSTIDMRRIRRRSTAAHDAPEDIHDLTSTLENTGYLDKHGYLIEWNRVTTVRGTQEMRPHALGEGTYFTALAVVALASGNHAQDTWEASNADDSISRFLDVLTNKSWGNMDELGRLTPSGIRTGKSTTGTVR